MGQRDKVSKCLLEKWCQGFPGGPVVENLPCRAGDTGLIPGQGRSHTPLSPWTTATEPLL